MFCSVVITILPLFAIVNRVYKRFIIPAANIVGRFDGAVTTVCISLLIGTRGTYAKKVQRRTLRQACRRLLAAGTWCGSMIAWAAHGGALQRSADAQRGGGSSFENPADHDLKKAVGSHWRGS